METKVLPVNKVAESGLMTLDLDKFYPKESVVELDISAFLFKGLVLREKDFREAVSNLEKEKYLNKLVGVFCSTDAIVPHWAYMLVATALKDIAKEVYFGDQKSVIIQGIMKNLESLNLESFRDQKLIIKGCGKYEIPAEAYMAATARLLPLVQSLMYGEACSTVPVYKRKIK